jgi:hypothetical protein
MKKINPQKHFLHKLKLINHSPYGTEENKRFLWRGIASDSNVGEVFPELSDKEINLFHNFWSMNKNRSKGLSGIVSDIMVDARKLVEKTLSDKYKDKKWKENDYVEDVKRVGEGYNREVMRITRKKRSDERYEQLEEYGGFSSNSPSRSHQMTRKLIPLKSFYEMVKQYFDKGYTEYQEQYFVDRLKDVMYAQWWFDQLNLRMLRTQPNYETHVPHYQDRPRFNVSSSTEDGKKIEILPIFENKQIKINVKVTYIEPLVITYKLLFNSKGILTIKCNLIYKQSDATHFNYPFNLKFGEFENNYETQINLKKDNLYRETGNDRTFYEVMAQGVYSPLKKKLFGLNEYNVPIVTWSTPLFALFNRSLFVAYPFNESEMYKLEYRAKPYNNDPLTEDEKIKLEKYSANRTKFSNTTSIPFGKYKNFWKNLIKRWFGKPVLDQFYIGKELDDKGKPKKYGAGFVIVPQTKEAERYYYLMFDKHSIENWEKIGKEKNYPRWQGMGLYSIYENESGSHYITSYFAPIYVDALSQAMLNDDKFSIGKTWYINTKDKDVDLTYPEQMQKFKKNFGLYKKWLGTIDILDSNSREYYVRELVLMQSQKFISKNEFDSLIGIINKKDSRRK